MKTPSLMKNFAFLAIFSLNATVQAAQVEDHAQIIASAGPMIKKAVQVLDVKIIDSVIITTCAGYGAMAGNYVSIKMMENISYMAGGSGRFNVNERYEDDMGRILGTVAGYHTGRFVVYLRHKITDPLFPQLYNLGEAGLNAGKTLCENTATWFSQYTCTKVQAATNYLKNYAQKKNN